MVEGPLSKGASAPPLTNVMAPCTGNGVVRCHPEGGGRKVHDGFATIRSGGKRGRARSSPSVAATNGGDTRPKTCPGCCVGSGTGAGPQMEPLWEERNGVDVKAPTVTRRDPPKIPWWEVATRRSRYRSCPAFSQASIVSALEQTVSDVTDRLERLASSPDLKVAEADELRRSAAILRRQSSAVSQSVSSGYFSLDRQASCDSVSSVTSSVSNATHVSFNSMSTRVPHHQHCPVESNATDQGAGQETAKIKKSNWLRASFRRAFGKNGRKQNKPTDNSRAPPNNWDTTSSPCCHQHLSNHCCSTQHRDEPKQHYHSCYSLLRNRQVPIIEPHKDNKYIVKENAKQSEIISRLQRLLQEKERTLTESKLELAAAQHSVKEQAEIINRLKTEAEQLKEENNRLNILVKSKFGSVVDADSTQGVDNMSVMKLSNSNGTYATVSHMRGKKVKLYIRENTVLETSSKASTIALESVDETAIFAGTVSILPKSTWEELDNMVAEIFQEYCSRLDPGNSLGLGRESLMCYRVGEALRADDQPKPDLLPYGYCVGNVDGIHMWLKGPLQKDTEYSHGNVASLCFTHGIPASTLKHLLNLLHETRRIIIVGPKACGKRDIAYQLARCYVASKGVAPESQSVMSFTLNGTNSLELCQLLTTTFSRERTTSGSQSSANTEELSTTRVLPEVLIINDLQSGSGVVETLQRCLSSNISKGPAIIATSQNAPILVTRLQVHCSFRWVGFSVQEEPVRGTLGRMLRRPLLAAEISSGMNLPVVHRTFDWLTRLWLHLNSLLAADAALGPLLLVDCPLDQEEARSWFVKKWNSVLAPSLNEMLKGETLSNDPKEWVVSTFPWKTEADALISLVSLKYPPMPKIPLSSYFSSAFSAHSYQIRKKEPQSNNITEPSLTEESAEISTSTGVVSNTLTTTNSNHDSHSSDNDDDDDDVLYTKPHFVIPKLPLFGSFSTFVSNEKDLRDGFVFTPVMKRNYLGCDGRNNTANDFELKICNSNNNNNNTSIKSNNINNDNIKSNKNLNGTVANYSSTNENLMT